MDNLLIKSQKKISNVPIEFKRYLLDRINWSNRLISIRGARGSGKTTLLLQYAKIRLQDDGSVLYVAMDDLFFMENSLYALADEFEKSGGKYLLLDEVHKYPGWSREIKLIYDDIPELRVVFTASSILEIYSAESDLSRRAVVYDLAELSIREFLELKNGIRLNSYVIDDLIENHEEIAEGILKVIKPIKEFKSYLKYGAYPYFIEDQDTYHQRLMNTINLIIDIDINAVENLEYNVLTRLKRLLFTIGSSVPFTPNITELSKKVGISRPTLIKSIQLLNKARLLKLLYRETSGIGYLTKPEKIYLNNTNINYALNAENLQKGTLRETFFINQVSESHKVKMVAKTDFEVNGMLFEIGGKNKSGKQIKGEDNAFIVRDDIEKGVKNIIPLWLFGFLY